VGDEHAALQLDRFYVGDRPVLRSSVGSEIAPCVKGAQRVFQSSAPDTEQLVLR
jgi:hypothetical protein